MHILKPSAKVYIYLIRKGFGDSVVDGPYVRGRQGGNLCSSSGQRHDTGFDSLAFAILVARLEDELGVDPFTISQDAAFPATVGDFVRAYENVPA